MSDKPIAIVTSVCPGTGSAIVRRFAADGFRVIAMARSPDRIRALEGELTWPTMSAAGGTAEVVARLVSFLEGWLASLVASLKIFRT